MDLQPFISRFETTAQAYELTERLYATELAKCLEGPAMLVYRRRLQRACAQRR